MQAQHPVAPRKPTLQKDPTTVVVLKATEPIYYKFPRQRKKKVFLATVAASDQVFQVKVLNIKLKKEFEEKNVITMSHYMRYKNVLEINEKSTVQKAPGDQTVDIPDSIWMRAKTPPKIDDLYQEDLGNLPTIVSGLFLLHKKKDNRKTTTYVIQDDTGTIEVVGHGICYGIDCGEGDTLRLFCFYLKKIKEKLKLTSGRCSVIEVIKSNKSRQQESSLTLKLTVEVKSSPVNPSRDHNRIVNVENIMEE